MRRDGKETVKERGSDALHCVPHASCVLKKRKSIRKDIIVHATLHIKLTSLTRRKPFGSFIYAFIYYIYFFYVACVKVWYYLLCGDVL